MSMAEGITWEDSQGPRCWAAKVLLGWVGFPGGGRGVGKAGGGMPLQVQEEAAILP